MEDIKTELILLIWPEEVI